MAVVVRLVTAIATDKYELQTEIETTNLQYTAFRENMTLAIEHKTEENRVSPCLTNTLLAERHVENLLC